MVGTAPLLLTFKSRVEVDIGNPPKLQILEVAGGVVTVSRGFYFGQFALTFRNGIARPAIVSDRT